MRSPGCAGRVTVARGLFGGDLTGADWLSHHSQPRSFGKFKIFHTERTGLAPAM